MISIAWNSCVTRVKPLYQPLNYRTKYSLGCFTLWILVLLLILKIPDASAARYAAVIVEEKTGKILHAVNPDLRTYPASLTKMMTLYLVFEKLKTRRLSLNQRLVVSRRAARRPKSRLGLKRGHHITVRQAIGALITKSANDVATVIAEELSGSENKFSNLMTYRAQDLGMTRTKFKNASGLPNRAQITTARDIARLAIALKRNFPQNFHFFAMRKFKYRGRIYRNHNKLLKRLSGADGIKTGYIRDSGFNIVVSVNHKKRRLIGVVFGGKSARRRDLHVITLFKRVFRMLAETDRAAENKLAQSVKLNPGYKKRRQRFAKTQRIFQPIDEEGRAWSVQVGAFQKFGTAHLAVLRAAKIVTSLRRARVSITKKSVNGGKTYRARLIGISHAHAQIACNKLKKHKINCMVVHEKTTAQGDG